MIINKLNKTNSTIYMKNTKWTKPQMAMSEEFIMMIGEYRIYVRVMCPKKISTSDYNSLTTFCHKTKILKLKGLLKKRTF